MTKVSELVSQNVGSAITNFQTWGGILYNVKAYGAKGDGITDDTTAITAALAAAAVTGGEVFFPTGTYIYSALFSPASNVVLNGVYGASIIKMKAGALPAFAFINVGNISNVIIKNLTFQGNLVLPATGAGTAEAVMFFLNCTNITIENCNFSNYMGMGIAFQGGLNTNVYKSNFTAMGQNQIGLHPNKSVPAVWSAYSNKGTKVIDCTFEDCRWAAVYMLGVDGVTDNCRINNIGETGIYSEYSSTSPTNNHVVTNNRISNVYQVDVTACGIEWSTSNSVISHNVVSLCAADGIAIGPCSYVNVANNVSFDNNVGNTLGGRGIGVNNKGGFSAPTAGKGIKILGNTCYDDRTPALQLYGIQFQALNGGSNFLNSMISNNILYRNLTADFDAVPGVLDDPTNIISKNNGWLDVQKDVSSAVTTSGITQQVLKLITIPPNSLGLTGGIRITAWGTVTGTTNQKVVYLKYDTSDTEFAFIQHLAADNGIWRIDAEIFNQGATNVQRRAAICYYKGTVIYNQFNSAGAINSTLSKNIAILGQCTNAADTITCNGLIVERI